MPVDLASDNGNILMGFQFLPNLDGQSVGIIRGIDFLMVYLKNQSAFDQAGFVGPSSPQDFSDHHRISYQMMSQLEADFFPDSCRNMTRKIDL